MSKSLKENLGCLIPHTLYEPNITFPSILNDTAKREARKYSIPLRLVRSHQRLFCHLVSAFP